MKNRILWLLAILAGTELASLLVYTEPLPRSLIALGLCACMLIVSYRQPAIGLGVITLELLVGSKGALFKLGLSSDPDAGLPIRMLLFAAFLVGWLIVVIEKKRYLIWKTFLRTHWYYVLMAVLLVYGFVLGVLSHQPFVFSDANAWGFLLLVLPVLDIVRHDVKQVREWIPVFFMVGLIDLAVKTCFLFYFFSHPFPNAVLDYVYLWVRRTGVGEVTRILPGQSAFRVFFQSHIYAVFAVFWLMAVIVFQKWWSFKRSVLVLTLSMTVVLISFSRSFWIGLVGGGLVFFALLLVDVFKKRISWKHLGISSTGVVLSIILSLVLTTGLLLFPLPGGDRTRLDQLLFARATASDDAAQSRWSLLPILWNKIKQHPLLGHGFGTTVTYQSKDPRIVQTTGGSFTTYIFEWGWLDIWIKLGILGIPVMLGWFVWLGYRACHVFRQDRFMQLSILSTLIAFVCVHAFTPYLNHPLGLGYLLFIEGLLSLRKTA